MNKYVVTREEIEELDAEHKQHFLSENAQRKTKSLGDLTGLTGFGFHIVEIEPGRESSELHRHYHEDECVYILEGEAEARVGDDIYRVKASDFIGYRAEGEAHTLKNIGAALLRYLVVGERLDHDVVDYPKKNKRLFRNKGLNWNLVDTGDISEPQIGRKSK